MSSAVATAAPTPTPTPTTIIVGEQSYIDSVAVQQVYDVVRRCGMTRAVGMPDLHPGAGYPVGCAFMHPFAVYPQLIGSDIGCGMTLYASELLVSRFKPDKMQRKFESFVVGIAPQTPALMRCRATEFDNELGTIGGGNHFAEFQEVVEIRDVDTFASLGIDATKVLLLTHSGSRSLGVSIVKKHTASAAKAKAGDHVAVLRDPAEIRAYISDHDNAVAWAQVNRCTIAVRMLAHANTRGTRVLDIVHNYLQCVDSDGDCDSGCNSDGDSDGDGDGDSDGDGGSGFIHRKGVGFVRPGKVSVIPGSRGSASYIVKMTSDVELAERHLCSIAHGAGRRFSRSEAESRARANVVKNDFSKLTTTPLGSTVVCSSKSLLLQEAPGAYKDVAAVVADLVACGLITVVAVTHPLMTYKN